MNRNRLRRRLFRQEYWRMPDPKPPVFPFRVFVTRTLYDGRDGIMGSVSELCDVAMTYGWAKQLIKRWRCWVGPDGDVDFSIHDRDGRIVYDVPQPRPRPAYVNLTDDDVPF
jgi:hypothetical protein